MAHVKATIGSVPYAVTLRSGRHELIADEPERLGGRDAGLAPYDLLLASLGACTAITLKMYADRKQWVFESLTVELLHRREGDRSHVDRTITVVGSLTPEQLARMGEIAEKTPVTLTLRAGVDIRTVVR